jgi:hypothetical protein
LPIFIEFSRFKRSFSTAKFQYITYNWLKKALGRICIADSPDVVAASIKQGVPVRNVARNTGITVLY